LQAGRFGQQHLKASAASVQYLLSLTTIFAIGPSMSDPRLFK
jgi:hypothetical protein